MISVKDWKILASGRLAKILKIAQSNSKLSSHGPKVPWIATVVFVGNPEMSRLNNRYRNKDFPTDILSFSSFGPFWDAGLLGELVICLPVLKNQARESGQTPTRELEVLLVHGVLHLLGFDHEQGQKEARIMSRWEERLLTEIRPQKSKFKAKNSKRPGLIKRSR